MKIYTDGSNQAKTGRAGFGVVVFDDDNKLLYAHSKESETASTNNE